MAEKGKSWASCAIQTVYFDSLDWVELCVVWMWIGNQNTLGNKIYYPLSTETN